jgi:hypothetical protein
MPTSYNTDKNGVEAQVMKQQQKSSGVGRLDVGINVLGVLGMLLPLLSVIL